MAFFKFRWPGKAEPAEKSARRSRAPQGESVEVMRRRARHRLIGAAVLVLVGVVGFPLLFDTQPRPVAVDIPIQIPDRNKTSPLVVAAAPERAPAASSSAAPAPAVKPAPASAKPVAPERVANAGLVDGEELVATSSAAKAAMAPAPKAVPPAKPEVKHESKPVPEPKREPKPDPKPEPKVEPKSAVAAASAPVTKDKAARTDDAARARALLEGRSSPEVSAPADDARFIVQVGAFSDADKAKEARGKLEKAGLKTYTQVVETKDGKRVRVRVGPFASRADADKAAARIKSLELSASVLTL